MALRDEWQFDYKSGDVATAARVKANHHETRLDFWKHKMSEVMEEVRAEGIDVKESAAGQQYSNQSYGPQVVIRADLQRDLNECHGKIQEHQSKHQTYLQYGEALDRVPEQVVKLDIADIVYFWGR